MRGVTVMAGVVVLSMIWCNIIEKAGAEMDPTECKEEMKLAVNACKPVLYRRSLSSECCENVRVIHVECVCPYVSPQVASIIRFFGLNYVVKKIEGCGRAVPHNFTCGSKLLVYPLYWIGFQKESVNQSSQNYLTST